MSRLSHLVSNNERNEKEPASTCELYEKTGSCPNDYIPKCCPYKHPMKLMSRCLVFHHLYPNPEYFASFLPKSDQSLIKNRYNLNFVDAFFLDVYAEFKLFGNVQDIIIASNITQHLYGNVYVRFNEPDEALACHKALEGRFYAGRKVTSSLLFVEKLTSLICEEESNGKCDNGTTCPCMHPFIISKNVYWQAFPRSLFTTPTALLQNTPGEYITDPNSII